MVRPPRRSRGRGLPPANASTSASRPTDSAPSCRCQARASATRLADWKRDAWRPCPECGGDSLLAVWSPDGERLLLARNDTLFAHPINGAVPDEVIVREAGRRPALGVARRRRRALTNRPRRDALRDQGHGVRGPRAAARSRSAPASRRRSPPISMARLHVPAGRRAGSDCAGVPLTGSPRTDFRGRRVQPGVVGRRADTLLSARHRAARSGDLLRRRLSLSRGSTADARASCSAAPSRSRASPAAVTTCHGTARGSCSASKRRGAPHGRPLQPGPQLGRDAGEHPLIPRRGQPT